MVFSVGKGVKYNRRNVFSDVGKGVQTSGYTPSSDASLLLTGNTTNIYIHIYLNITNIRCAVVPETCVSLHHLEAQFRASPKTLEHHGNMVSRGQRGALNWDLIMPKNASVSEKPSVTKHMT